MAVALLTTFYGAILANLVFAPLAGRLERKSTDDALINEIYLAGIASMVRKENPRRLAFVLNTLLAPSQRITRFA